MLKFIESYLLISWTICAVCVIITGILRTDNELMVIYDANRERFWRCIHKAWTELAERSFACTTIKIRCVRILIIIFAPQLLANWLINNWYNAMILALAYYLEELS